MNKLTHSQFVATLAGIAGVAIVGFEALTDARARKTNNPHGKILKQSRVVGFVGANYASAVQREGDRQGVDATDFKARSLPHGEWLVPGKVIVHNGKYFLRTQSTPGQRDRQPSRILAYRNEAGQYLSPESVRPFLPVRSASRKQEDAGLEGQVRVQNYGFDSIRKVRIAGKTFELVAG